MLGTTKTVNHQNPRNRLYAGFECLSHKICCILVIRGLASIAHHRHHRHCHYHWFPYLEAQTR